MAPSASADGFDFWDDTTDRHVKNTLQNGGQKFLSNNCGVKTKNAQNLTYDEDFGRVLNHIESSENGMHKTQKIVQRKTFM